MSGSLSYDRPEVLKFAVEKRLNVEVEANTCKSFVSNEEVGDPYPSLYFRTCLEELTRNYISFTVAAEDSATMEVEDCKPKNAASLRFPAVWQLDNIETSQSDTKVERSEEESEGRISDTSRFMRVYHPNSFPFKSNFRKVPSSNKDLLGDWTCGHTKVLLNIGPSFKVRYNKHVFFEPIFGSVCLYSMNKKIDTDITKITESFHFDATPPSLRDSCRKVYKTDLHPEEVHHGDTKSEHGGDDDQQDINPHSECSRCLFCVPTNVLETHDIFVVVQLTKVLTGDPDKALLPYTSPDKKNFLGNSSTDIDTNNAIKSCNRLHRFRQPVGLSVVKMFEEDGSIVGEKKGGHVAPVYSTKYCANESTLKLIIQDMQVDDGGNSSGRPNSHRVLPPRAELDVSLTMVNLGPGGDLSSIDIPEGMPHVPIADKFHFLPSQYLTEAAANDFRWHTELGPSIADLISVRTVLPLLHPACALADPTMSGFRASVDNSLFLYPSSLEHLPKNFRNLCVRVQLIEFNDSKHSCIDSDPVSDDSSPYHAYTVLKNIYSTMPGDFFCQSAYTTVSYHKPTPEFNDEIKVCLPLKLNGNHALFFQFFHIHVKNKEVSRRNSIFSHKNHEDKIMTLFGSGHLPLLENGNALLSDGEYNIPILEVVETPPLPSTVSCDTSHDSVSSMQSLRTSASTRVSSSRKSFPSSSSSNAKAMPLFTIRTKAVSSFVSQDEDLQDYLTCHPPCLGHLPSLSPRMMKDIEYTVLPKEYIAANDEKSLALSYNSPSHSINEDTLKDKTMFFTRLGYASKPTKVEVCKHFFGIMRQLTRAMCGGGVGEFSTKYANPFTHSELRCTSFIAMLRVFDIVTPKNAAASGNSEQGIEGSEDETISSFLQTYVDFMFDEEVYTYISPSARKFDSSGKRSEKKSTVKLIGGKINRLLGRSDSSVDNIKKQENDDKEEAFLEHIYQQCETIVLQGAVLSAIGKASNEILTTGTIKLTPKQQKKCEEIKPTRTVANVDGSSRNPRWWKGCTEMKSMLTTMTEAPENLDIMLRSYRINVNPLKEPIVIEPILPTFDKLDGFSLRSFVIEEELQRERESNLESGGYSNKGSKSNASHNYLKLQWWPWMYEIISFQWISLLHIFQEDILDKDGASTEDISKIEEGEEDEGDEELDSNEGETLQWNSGKRYPLSELKELFLKRNEIRTMLINHGPTLLTMIIKSIALRIHREQKSTPVIMDQDFMQLMEELLGTLAQEVHSKGTSLLPARNLNIAISHFLRDIFAFITPLQSSQLVYSYFLSSRKSQKKNFEKTQKVQVNHITDRFYFLKELTFSDHFFAFNFPLHVGSPHAAYRYAPIFSLKDLLSRSSVSRIRGIQSPPSHWLAHLLIYEVMADFDSLEKNLKETAMKLIRSIVVHLCYDKRFQSREYKHRVASMFIPLLSCIVEDVQRIRQLPSRSEERKDSLALVLFILQDIPDYLLREELRSMMTVCAVNPIKLKYHHRVVSSGTHSAIPLAKGPSVSDHQHFPIFDLISLFHLVVDTFEFPNENEMDACLSPGVHIVDAENTVDVSTVKGNIGTRGRVGTNDALSMLENRYANKPRVTRKRTSGDRTTGLGADNSTVIRSSDLSSRKDALRSRSITASDASVTMKQNLKTGVKQTLINVVDGISAAKHVSNESSMHVLHTLRLLINESITTFEPDVRSIYCDTVLGSNMRGIMRNSLNLLLHMLHMKQSEGSLCEVYLEAIRILTILGAKNFIRSLFKDSLQYWMRQTLLHCGSYFLALREAASTFLGHMLFSCFDNFGSFRPVSTPIFGILRDVVEVLEKSYEDRSDMLKKGVHLKPFSDSFAHAKKVVATMECRRDQNRRAVPKEIFVPKSCILAFDDLFSSLQGLLNVYSFINCKLDFLSIKYDWKGGNFLDTVDYDYEDSIRVTSCPKKSVGFDMMSESFSKAVEGVDLEWMLELMIEGSNLLADYELPRVRMYLLENVARMQDILGNHAEAGVARWEIYLTLKHVEKHFAKAGRGSFGVTVTQYWCPRPPLKLMEADGGDFLTVFQKALSQPAPTAWESEQQFYKHMVTVLTMCIKRFKDAKLTFLAERACHALIECYRRDNFDENESLPLIAKTFQQIHELYAMSSVGRTTFAMGTFYRVQFLGKGNEFQT